MSVNPAARDAAARAFYIAGCDDREWGERAWVDMGGSEPSYERAEIEIAAAAALAAALPHLTPADVPHVAAQALRDAADEAEHAAQSASAIYQTPARDRITAAWEGAAAWLRDRAYRLSGPRTAQDATKPPHPYPSDPPTGTTRQEDV